MPSLNDIMEMAELLETKAVYVTPDRCVAVRNRNAKCRKCVDACPVEGALSVGGNKLEFNMTFCVSCGACTAACPTEALSPTKPLDADLAEEAARACERTGERAVFACARISSRGIGNPEKYVEVPCLARMEETLLLELAAQGVDSVVLVDGTCRTCKYRYVSQGIDDVVDSTNSLLAAWGSDARVERASAFPEEALLHEGDAVEIGASRRAFFARGRDKAKEGARSTVLKALKNGERIPTLKERLKIAENGALPQFDAVRRPHALDALDRIGPACEEEVFTRLWGRVEIDYEACNGCVMCTVFCPTGALSRSEEPCEGGVFLEFSTSDCVQCDSCADICLKKCLTVEPVVRVDELMSFEPRLIEIPEQKRSGLLGRSRK